MATGGMGYEPKGDGAPQTDKAEVVSFDAAAGTPDAPDVELVIDGSSAAGDGDAGRPDGGGGDAASRRKKRGAEGTSESEPTAAGGALSKVRGASQIKINTARLKELWRAHSIARVALLAVCSYALCVGAAYFFLMQPLDIKLHEVKEQKSILHDYSVIQQAGAAIGKFKDGLMTGDQRLTVLSEVNQMAEHSGVKIVGDPDLLLKRNVSAGFVEYPVRLRVRASFHEIGEFLSLLESSPRFVIVEEVEMRSEVDSRDHESEATVLLALASWED